MALLIAHPVCVEDVLTVKGLFAVTLTVCVLVQPFASEIIAEYVPAVSPVAV